MSRGGRSRALVHFVLAAALWLIWLGWLISLWSYLDAALHRPPRPGAWSPVRLE